MSKRLDIIPEVMEEHVMVYRFTSSGFMSRPPRRDSMFTFLLLFNTKKKNSLNLPPFQGAVCFKSIVCITCFPTTEPTIPFYRMLTFKN